MCDNDCDVCDNEYCINEYRDDDGLDLFDFLEDWKMYYQFMNVKKYRVRYANRKRGTVYADSLESAKRKAHKAETQIIEIYRVWKIFRW